MKNKQTEEKTPTISEFKKEYILDSVYHYLWKKINPKVKLESPREYWTMKAKETQEDPELQKKAINNIDTLEELFLEYTKDIRAALDTLVDNLDEDIEG